MEGITCAETFPPKPTVDESSFPDQTGRVVLITGGSSGIGFEVAKVMYHLNAKVYIASRTESSALCAIDTILSSPPPWLANSRPGKWSNGTLIYLKMDVSDLSTIYASIKPLLDAETRLDVVWHNAGVMVQSSNAPLKNPQGHENMLATNCLGPFLLQKYLTPLVLRTSQLPGVKPGQTRVVWVSSSGHRSSPKPDGVNWDDMNMFSLGQGVNSDFTRYGQSKAINAMHAHEFARRYGKSHGIVSVSLHPGFLKTNLQEHTPTLFMWAVGWMLKPARFGGLTLLWAGLGDEMEETKMMEEEGGRNGGYVLPWGRYGKGAEHVFEGLEKRGTGERLWDVCENLVKEFVVEGRDG